MASNPITLQVPLTHEDQKALFQIFGQLKIEDIQQIEAINTGSFELLEPWEEQGWILNSSLPLKNV